MRGAAGTLVVLAALSGCTVFKDQGGERVQTNIRPPGPAAQTAWKQNNAAAAQANRGPAVKGPAAPGATALTPQSPWPMMNGHTAAAPPPAAPADRASGALMSATFVETPRGPAADKPREAAPEEKPCLPACTGAGVASTVAVEMTRIAASAVTTPPAAPRPLPPMVQSSAVLPPPEPPAFPTVPTVPTVAAPPAAPEVRQASSIVPQPPSAPSVRMVNSRRINLNYELKDVGESGISGIELWYTQDTRSWQKYEGPVQKQGPYVVEVNGEGLYGFTMVARSGVGFSRDVPQAGELPQVWVEVDLTRPAVQITGVELNCTPKAQNLIIRWNASDKNLTARPITLSYAEKADGPWTPIAANLENTGKYEWLVPASVPKRICVRVEASDLVGHLGAAHTADAVLIDRARPTVSILTVEPDKKN